MTLISQILPLKGLWEGVGTCSLCKVTNYTAPCPHSRRDLLNLACHKRYQKVLGEIIGIIITTDIALLVVVLV